MLDDLVKLKTDMEEYRQAALRFADFSPDDPAAASYALSRIRNPLWPDVAARGALLAERAVKLCDGIASLVNRPDTETSK